MNLRRSGLDTLLVARFEVLRAIRTWRAVALVLLYVIANVGCAYLFIEALSVIENGIATQMGVPTTRWPGALTEQVRNSEQLVQLMGNLVGDEDVATDLLSYPFLAVFQLWQGFVLIPFLAAASASEAIAIDMRTRALRFEALRTGRPELLIGRFVGQAVLMVAATLVALAAVWVLGISLTVSAEPVRLALGLLSLGMRAVVFALPFAAFGIACSAWTTSPAWARVMALSGTSISWVLYGMTSAARDMPWTLASDIVQPLLPQTWMNGLWQADGQQLMSASVLAALALVCVGVGYARFGGRDL